MLDEETTTLSALDREMIAVVVSAANRCYYCLVAHGQAVRALSGDLQLGEMMVMNYRVAELPARQRVMLDFAWKLTTTPFDIGDPDWATLREAGFSDGDIFDITDVVAFFNYTNRMAHGLDMMPNAECRIPRHESVTICYNHIYILYKLYFANINAYYL